MYECGVGLCVKECCVREGYGSRNVREGMCVREGVCERDGVCEFT